MAAAYILGLMKGWQIWEKEANRANAGWKRSNDGWQESNKGWIECANTNVRIFEFLATVDQELTCDEIRKVLATARSLATECPRPPDEVH